MPQLPPSPPAIIQPVGESQSQSQAQSQNQYTAPSIESSNSNNAGSNSNSESTNVLSQAGSLENVQINNSSSGTYDFAPGVSAPTPTISVTTYSHSGSNGIAATLTVPLGGNVGRQHRKLVDSRIKRIDLDNNAITTRSELELATACAKIAAANVTLDYSLFPSLAVCSGVKVNIPPVVVITPLVQRLISPVKVEQSPKQKEPIKPRPVPALW